MNLVTSQCPHCLHSADLPGFVGACPSCGKDTREALIRIRRPNAVTYVYRLSRFTNVCDVTPPARAFLKSIGHVGATVGESEVWVRKIANHVVAAGPTRESVDVDGSEPRLASGARE
jgi:hypothetical protein